LKTGNAQLFAMKKLGSMSAEETNEFCGQCHRTWAQIAMNGPHGVLNVRFQPYRLTNGRCYDVDDQRIKCTSCHDPHREVDKISTDYDRKCLACHGGGKPGAKACTVASKGCTSCHMPKIDLPRARRLRRQLQLRRNRPLTRPPVKRCSWTSWCATRRAASSTILSRRTS